MENELRKRWEEYEQLSGLGEHYSALVRIADVYSCLNRLPHELRTDFEKRCQSIRLDRAALESVQAGIKKAQRKIMRILAIGTKWNDDEFLLLITLQVETDLLRSFLNAKGGSLRNEAHEKCLLAISEAGETEKNRNAFKAAASLARQNWGLPITHKLFE